MSWNGVLKLLKLDEYSMRLPICAEKIECPNSRQILFLAVWALGAFSTSGNAKIERLQCELFGFVDAHDARQIRRLLSPWAEAEDVTFHATFDKYGKQRLFTTLVRIVPRTDDKYRESHTLQVYQMLQQLRDSRFRGRQAASQSWVLKSELTVSGELFTHRGWARSYIRNVPFWRRWRADTSVINHVMFSASGVQKIVFSDSDRFDQLRQYAGQADHEVEVNGVIAGFDGPYPIVTVRSYRLQQSLETHED
mgnify:CR=1 FL=1